MHPRPRKVVEEKLLLLLFFFVFVFVLLMMLVVVPGMVVSEEEALLEKVERRREEMVDLQRVEWIMEGIGSDSGMNWVFLCLLLHCRCSVIAEAFVTTGMVMIQREREIEGGE